MDINLVHASITGKKISTFARVVTEVFNCFFVKLFLGHPVSKQSSRLAAKWVRPNWTLLNRPYFFYFPPFIFTLLPWLCCIIDFHSILIDYTYASQKVFALLYRIFEIVVVIFDGKSHPFNALLRYPFEVNNRYQIELLG